MTYIQTGLGASSKATYIACGPVCRGQGHIACEGGGGGGTCVSVSRESPKEVLKQFIRCVSFISSPVTSLPPLPWPEGSQNSWVNTSRVGF